MSLNKCVSPGKAGFNLFLQTEIEHRSHSAQFAFGADDAALVMMMMMLFVIDFFSASGLKHKFECYTFLLLHVVLYLKLTYYKA